MYPTKNTLDQKIRFQSVSILQDRLSHGIDLMLQAKQAHWNVKGENFYSLHLLFDEIHSKTQKWVDLMAERIAQLGGMAEGTLHPTLDRSKLPEYPLNISHGTYHVDALSESLAYFGELVRVGSDDLSHLGDADSSDMLTQISRGTNQYLWMVEAHLQDKKASQDTGEPQMAQEKAVA